MYITNKKFQLNKTVGFERRINENLMKLEEQILTNKYFPVQYDKAARVTTYDFSYLTYNEKLGGIELSPAAYQTYYKNILYDEILESSSENSIDYCSNIDTSDKYRQRKLTPRQTDGLERVVFTQGSVWTEIMMNDNKVNELMAIKGTKLKIHPMMNMLNVLEYRERFGKENIIGAEYSSNDILDLDLESVHMTGVTELNITAVIKGQTIKSIHNFNFDEDNISKRPIPGFFKFHQYFVENGDNTKRNCDIINSIFGDYRSGFYFPELEDTKEKLSKHLQFLQDKREEFRKGKLN